MNQKKIPAGDMHRENTGNLRPPWKPGQSGNPKGRPPNIRYLTEILRDEVDKPCPPIMRKRLSGIIPKNEKLTIGQATVVATINNMINGNAAAIKQIWDRLDGKVPQPITGPDGGPIHHEIDARAILLERLKKLKSYMSG